VLSQCGKFEINVLVDRQPMKMLKDGRWMGASRDSVTSNNFSECILVTLKPTNVFLCGAKKQGIGVVKPGAH